MSLVQTCHPAICKIQIIIRLPKSNIAKYRLLNWDFQADHKNKVKKYQESKGLSDKPSSKKNRLDNKGHPQPITKPINDNREKPKIRNIEIMQIRM